MHRSRVLFAASALVVLAFVALFVVRANDREPSRQLTASGSSASTPTTDVPDLLVPDDVVAETTTTTAPVVTTTTAKVAPTTTAAPTVTPTSTTVPTTTTLPPNMASITVVNHYDTTVKIGAGSKTSKEWTLQPNASDGPWLMDASNQYDGVNVTRTDSNCGSADGGMKYFTPGHSYQLEAIVDRSLGTGCGGVEGAPALFLLVHDLTTGTTARA